MLVYVLLHGEKFPVVMTNNSHQGLSITWLWRVLYMHNKSFRNKGNPLLFAAVCQRYFLPYSRPYGLACQKPCLFFIHITIFVKVYFWGLFYIQLSFESLNKIHYYFMSCCWYNIDVPVLKMFFGKISPRTFANVTSS